MAGFLYYKPGKRAGHRLTLEEVREWGLGYAFDRHPVSSECAHTTPDKKAGFVFADEKRLAGRTLGMYADEQEWRLVKGREDGLQIGWYRDAPPTAEDLQRETLLQGYQLDLVRGPWTVPLVRSYDTQAGVARSALPCHYALDDEGNVCRGRVLDQYAYLWDLTASYADALWDPEASEDAADVDAFSLAVKLLQANYAVDVAEVIALELFHELRPPTTVPLLAVDYGTFVAWMEAQKKTPGPEGSGGNAGSNTSAGDAG